MDDRNPTSDRLRRLASRYEAGVGRGRAEQIAARALTRAHRRSSVGRRLAVAVSSGAFLLVAMTGVGVAADRAVPGDFLHPLDRALEALGFTSDLVEERLLEAITLADRGEMALAIETANEALDELGRSGVTATLPAATQDLAVGTTQDEDEAATTTTTGVGVETTTVPETPDTVADTVPQVADDAEATVQAVNQPVDAVATLRLAAEQLLQSVRSAKSDPTSTGDVTTAALFLAETTAGASSNETTSDSTSSTTSSTSTSTSTSSTTTSTTAPSEPAPGNGNDQNSGTTTTTVASDPDAGSGSDSTGDPEDDSPGPIFLPSP